MTTTTTTTSRNLRQEWQCVLARAAPVRVIKPHTVYIRKLCNDVSFLWILPLLYFVRFTALYLCYTSLLVLLYYNVPSAEPTHGARLQGAGPLSCVLASCTLIAVAENALHARDAEHAARTCARRGRARKVHNYQLEKCLAARRAGGACRQPRPPPRGGDAGARGGRGGRWRTRSRVYTGVFYKQRKSPSGLRPTSRCSAASAVPPPGRRSSPPAPTPSPRWRQSPPGRAGAPRRAQALA